ncbi:MAG: hypothetical protein WD691_04635 [Acidimicrobiales bacterium]
MTKKALDKAAVPPMHGLCGTCVVVDGESLVVEDTVLHAVVTGQISDDFLDYGCDTYWCVNATGGHRVVRASELATAS